MAILNYTTEKDVHSSVAEIQAILGRKGARQISVDYGENAEPNAICFVMIIENRPIGFRLPRNVDGVYRALCKDRNVTPKYRTREQAARVSWRILKDWVEAQMAIVEAEQAQMAEVFLAYAIDYRTGQTMFEKFYGSLALTSGAEIQDAEEISQPEKTA